MTYTKDRLRATAIISLLIFGCAVMAVVETVFMPGYVVKSAVKAAVFLLCIAAYCLIVKRPAVLEVLKIRTARQLITPAVLGVSAFAVVVCGYAALRPFVDFGAVTGALLEKENITRGTFLYVSIYISIVNSFLEELFFRGFGYIILSGYMSKRIASIISAVCFALYHVAIMGTWFEPAFTAALIIALVIAGIILNALCRDRSIYGSWLVHMMANIGINTVGFMLFAA